MYPHHKPRPLHQFTTPYDLAHPILTYSSASTPHLADVAKVLDVVPLSTEDLIDDICAHLVLAALGLWAAVIGLSSPGPRGLVVVRGLILVHAQLWTTRQGKLAPAIFRSVPEFHSRSSDAKASSCHRTHRSKGMATISLRLPLRHKARAGEGEFDDSSYCQIHSVHFVLNRGWSKTLGISEPDLFILGHLGIGIHVPR